MLHNPNSCRVFDKITYSDFILMPLTLINTTYPVNATYPVISNGLTSQHCMHIPPDSYHSFKVLG